MILFSVPLILSGLFQQLFNWVDALIVGNVIGETGLAGIGATSSLLNMLLSLMIGFTSGLSVLFAQQYGEKKHMQNRDVLAVYSVLLTAVFTLVSVCGMVFISPILSMMNIPAVLLETAEQYLLIVMAGIPFLTVYNIYSAVLRGMGNSKVPFQAVLVSSVTNVLLDLFFIITCGYGIAGAACATVLAQIAMTVYIVCYAVRKYPELRFRLSGMKEYAGQLAKGAEYGTPSAVRSSVSSVGNVLLSRFLNGFGEETVAAITTAYRVDVILLLPLINFSTAISTMTAQETGAGNHENARTVFRLGTVMMLVISVVFSFLIVTFGKNLLALFGLGEEALAIGEQFFTAIAVFYVANGLSMSIKGYLEGIGDLKFSAAAGIASLGVRMICSYLFVGIFHNMVVAYAEAFSWVFAVVVFAFRLVQKRHSYKV